MGAHIGNNYAEKLKTPELKQAVYQDYCDHIAKGFPQQSWYYDKDGLMLTANSMENYLKRYPELCQSGKVFDPIYKEVARAKNYQKWFGVTAGSAEGDKKHLNANTASLQMIMRNIHGWDKSEKQNTEAPNEANLDQTQQLIERNAQLEEKLRALESKAANQHSAGESST